MKKILVFALLLLSGTPVYVSAGNTSPWETRLPFENVTIQYTITGMENGTERVYIRDFGRESATYHTTNTTMMGMTIVNETVDIDTPDWIYRFDITHGTGTKSVNPEKYMIQEYAILSSVDKKQLTKNAGQLGGSFAEGLGAVVEQNVKTILGYSCDRAEVMGSVVYTIHSTGLPLLVESSMMGMTMKMEAISVETGMVADAYFQFPQGIEARVDPESDTMAREMAKRTVAMLTDPEAAKKPMGMPMIQPGGQEQMTPEERQQMQQAMEMMKEMFGGQ